MKTADTEYLRLLGDCLNYGRVKQDRTGVGTIGMFGGQARFDLQKGFPLITTKRVHFRSIVHELLWFLSGSTNIKYLVDNDVHIWDDNAYDLYKKSMNGIYGSGFVPVSKEDFVGAVRNDTFPNVGDLGQGTYGQMWRSFPVLGEQTEFGEQDRDDRFMGLSVDQIRKVLDSLKNNPDSRRHIVSAWHPYWVDHCALPPCHCLFQFHTEELTWRERRDNCRKLIGVPEGEHGTFDRLGVPKRRLNCQLYQRSCDLFLGVPFNIASYALLTHMFAQVLNMVPGEFIWTGGDIHIYNTHKEQVMEQLSRDPKTLPELVLNRGVENLFDFKFEDIALEGYGPHPAIKAPMAV